MKFCTRPAALLFAPILAGAMAMAVPATVHSRDNVEKAEEALAKENANRAVSYAERAVAENPRDTETRVLLGEAYLKAGRMMSARDSLSAAVELGDASPRTALMLALAQIGAGESRLAIGTINMQGSGIPAVDRGLALALAGDAARGAEVLSADIRAGNNTPKSRQNLAYAYALGGRWREARAMAAQDVPAGQIGDRMTEWASTARPDLYAQRVAALMGAEAVDDRGMPQQLALANSAPTQPMPTPQIAAAPAHQMPSVQGAPQSGAARETSAVSLAVVPPPPITDSAPVSPRPRTPKPVLVASLPASTAVSTASPPPVRREAVSAPAATPSPVANPAPRVAAVAPTPAARPTPRPVPKRELPTPVASGTHIAQLGSYANRQAAEAGWKVFQSRYSNLGSARPVITKANVDGKDYWRVAAGGFDRQGANAMCAAVKAGGNGCIPIAQANGSSENSSGATARLAANR